MKRIIFFFVFLLILSFSLFSQESTDNNDDWKNKKLYTSVWLGYGSGFSMGIGADVQIFRHFALGLEAGLVDKNYPAISIFPKLTLRPWRIGIDLYAGLSFGYSTVYDFIWGVPLGIDVGYNLGPGLLFVTARSGMGWAFGIGYRMGFFNRN